MNRIDKVFNKLKEENKKALIPFISNGDPSIDATVETILELEKSGADIVEIGIPFSDPLADGPVIQEESLIQYQEIQRIKSTWKRLITSTH